MYFMLLFNNQLSLYQNEFNICLCMPSWSHIFCMGPGRQFGIHTCVMRWMFCLYLGLGLVNLLFVANIINKYVIANCLKGQLRFSWFWITKTNLSIKFNYIWLTLIYLNQVCLTWSSAISMFVTWWFESTSCYII